MNIEDFLADRAWGNYGTIYSDPEYRKCSDRLLDIYKIVAANLDPEGETIVNEIRSLHNRMTGITAMIKYKQGFADGLKLGWLLAEVKNDL